LILLLITHFDGLQLNAIPTIGYSDPILSYISAAQFNLNGFGMLKEGYEKVILATLLHAKLTLPSCLQTRPGLFKIASFRRWMVLASSPELIEDIRKAPDHVLSMTKPAFEVPIACISIDSYLPEASQSIQPDYTLDLLNPDDFYHTDIIRAKLTRNIAVTFKEVREELVSALDDMIQTRDDGAS
jgi:hypothetical protein